MCLDPLCKSLLAAGSHLYRAWEKGKRGERGKDRGKEERKEGKEGGKIGFFFSVLSSTQH